ncbi:hypothetical protein IAR55_002189 [Kwoniella newhampshirensis]|uniref:Calpain catalytic domain-containing protein n=1 Tax=Kwoniella newhampshirensis TaxID=1651941 RepID=A0AAW0Z0A8_9TREE
MAFNSYQEGLKLGADLANKAIAIESSLSTVSPLTSPLPILQKAFPIYISSAETYSHLLSSKLVPSSEIAQVTKKWRLVLERAEKIKSRVEQLGGQVGKAEVGDEGEEAAILRRGGKINGLTLDLWREPTAICFRGDKKYRDKEQPELAEEQIKAEAEWRELPAECWDQHTEENGFAMKQGPIADCSVVVAVGVGLQHNTQFGTKFGWDNLYPQNPNGRPIRSENGKHVLKVLLNGAWRSVVFDALLPHSRKDGTPLYTTCHPSSSSSSSSSTSSRYIEDIGAPWVPIALKGYFKVHGGYNLRGSNPAPDMYASTGWLPEYVSLIDGFQREKEWQRVYQAWTRGDVAVSLGTGAHVGEGLVPLHAYGVVGLREEDGERLLNITDPGAASFTMSWDRVCSNFEALNLNWDPALKPVVATRHWSWFKPSSSRAAADTAMSNPQYRLRVTSSIKPLPEIWILLSQHVTSNDKPLEDIALHVFEEYGASSSITLREAVQPKRADQTSPYANSVHVLVRYQLRRPDSNLLIIPARDRGNFQTSFTLNVYAPIGCSLDLERIARHMPFSETVSGVITSRNAGGHPGWPTSMNNPQYKVIVSPPARGGRVHARMVFRGEKDTAWNVKLLWGRGEQVFEMTEDMILANSGAYSYGMAFCDISDLHPGIYTMVISAFDPGQTGAYTCAFESTASAALTSIPSEGSGMFSRVVAGKWTEINAGGRPSGGKYEYNPKVEVILPKAGTILSRLYLPQPSPTPINLTIFKRGLDGTLGEQIATTGPYADTLTGVCTRRVKLDSGIYVFVPSTYEASKSDWIMKIWSDVAISAELIRA